MSDPVPMSEDWAVYQGVEDGLRAYLRDADLALDAIAGVINLADVQAFTCERVATTRSWGESLWQEVALTDGQRLILWHGDDEESDEAPGSLMFTSSVRTVPLTAIVDQGLRTRYSVEPNGMRSLHAVMLYLATQTPERSLTELTDEAGTKTVQFVETYRFSKSVTDGGRGQMQRLTQFGRALSRFSGQGS
ncbi:hypothetical protein EH165_02985 [Nakamurella antarctica]|uniref:Uncharacterized protein n=1 Tax=Nakamurella antarctica TaxID=1902245 RepID=A0A3G8ZJA1_9ACTN|nr:hypothetical protein [Nakamurella antarctica]AZI57278.1 hypothetical protein EH165_02985 [Nakamurella antarctica]